MFRLVLVIAVGGISHLAAADLSDTWTGALETKGSRVPVYLILKQQDGKPMPIENAKFHNDNLAFGVHDNAGQFVPFRLSLTGATLNGESRVGLQTSKATLRRGGRQCCLVCSGRQQRHLPCGRRRLGSGDPARRGFPGQARREPARGPQPRTGPGCRARPCPLCGELGLGLSNSGFWQAPTRAEEAWLCQSVHKRPRNP